MTTPSAPKGEIDPPDIGWDDEGCLTLDWSTGARHRPSVSASLSGDGKRFSVAWLNADGSNGHGVLSVEALLEKVRKVMIPQPFVKDTK